MSDVLREQFKTNRKAETSGIIINTCGWVKGDGYDHLKHIAQAFEVDLIIVLDEDRLYSYLNEDMPSFVKVVWLPRSIGVIERSQPFRIAARSKRVHSYFYGPRNDLEPFTFDLKFSQLDGRLFRIEKQHVFHKVTKSQPKDLMNRLLGLSLAKNEDDLVSTNVAGFICVTKVDKVAEKVTVLSPQPEPLPDGLFVISDIQFIN